jgi:hypothetical protein
MASAFDEGLQAAAPWWWSPLEGCFFCGHTAFVVVTSRAMRATYELSPRLRRPHLDVRRISHDLVVKLARTALSLCCLLLIAGAAHASPVVPPGSYHQSCKGAAMKGTTLVAQCKDFFGNEKATSLANAASCKNIQNIDGDLRCVVAAISAKRAPRDIGVDQSDVISVSDISTGGVQGKVWRIDRPNVWQRTTEYPLIKFKPGDKVWFKAGGCAQTGRHGASWDEYVWPQGTDSPTMYAGTAYIQMVTGSSVRRIGSLISCQPYQVPIPNPGEQVGFLTLGYEDNDYSDNGYWGHDNGERDQCKNVGPAWVEVTILPGTPPKGGTTQWSPGCKPFDLVWDVNKEDFNGLPLNPQWLFQLQHKGDQPDFGNMCGSAFPDPKSVDYTKLGQECTSQDPTTDIHYVFFGACSGWPLQGHVNWMIATYQGPVWWEGISGQHPGYPQWDNSLYDDDYNMDLKPQREAGLTRSGDRGKPHPPAVTIHMEMDPKEGVEQMGSPFWKKWQGNILSGGALSAQGYNNAPLIAMFGGEHGLYGVATGLFGLDADHGGFTELHPIYAMAVRTSFSNEGGKIREHWAYFLRNYGSQGGCASNGLHMWDSPGGDYFIQIPKVEGATMGPPTDVSAWEWAKGTISKVSFMQSKDWMVVKIRPAHPTDPFGMDGELTLSFTLPAGKKAKSAPAPEGRPKAREEERESKDFSANIADPAVRAKFQAAMKAPPSSAPAMEKSRLEVSPEVTTIQRSPGAASKGQATATRVVTDPARQQRDAQLKQVMQTYSKDLKTEVPANPESKATVVRSKPAAAPPASEPPKPQPTQ